MQPEGERRGERREEEAGSAARGGRKGLVSAVRQYSGISCSADARAPLLSWWVMGPVAQVDWNRLDKKIDHLVVYWWLGAIARRFSGLILGLCLEVSEDEREKKFFKKISHARSTKTVNLAQTGRYNKNIRLIGNFMKQLHKTEC